jgi:hypothetical protein
LWEKHPKKILSGLRDYIKGFHRSFDAWSDSERKKEAKKANMRKRYVVNVFDMFRLAKKL